MFRFNGSPCRCRSELTPLNRGNKGNRLFKRKLLQQTVPGPKKGGNLPSSDRPQLAQQLCRELPFCFSNGEHFLSEETPKKGRLDAMHRPKDAYLSVNVHKSSQKYLCFQWRNRFYAFQGLSFGLNTAHRVFTKLIKPIAAYLRKRRIRIIVYLNDFLILGSSIKESKANTRLTLDLLQWLGFTIIWEKSMLVPTQSLTFLGLSIDSQSMSLSFPQKKIMNIQSKCQSLIHNPTSSAREIASLVGSLETARPAIWQATPYYRELQIQLIKSLEASRDNYKTLMSLSSDAHTEL